MNELGMLVDLLVKLSAVGVGWAAVAYLFTSRGDEVDKVRQRYEAVIKSKDEVIKDLRERLEYERAKHKEELMQYTKTSKMLKELGNALNAGAVKLRCPQHPDAEVTLLADGTIVCSKGHRIWPPEGEAIE